MGAYINPPTGKSKEDWLRENAEPTTIRTWDEIPSGKSLVIWMDNSVFTAAGIAFSERELKDFMDPSDTRPKNFYLVDTDLLYDVSDLSEYLPKGVRNNNAKGT